MNLETMIERVKRVVQDDLYDDDAITELLNAGMMDCAAKVLLPELEHAEDVTTVVSSSFLAFPTDYHRGLFAAKDSNGRDAAVYRTFASMLRIWGRSGETGGSVGAVAPASGGRMTYVPIPADPQTLTIYYYRKPTAMVADDDEPDGLPEDAHKALVHYACKEIFAEMEDGIEGKKVNTNHHESKYLEMLAELDRAVGPLVSHPPAPVCAGDFM